MIIRGTALTLPITDESVDLIVTSPPYFALRSYRDGDEHYTGQIGSEETPAQFVEALMATMAEAWRVLKPSGSCFVNLGDKYAGSGGGNQGGLLKGTKADRVIDLRNEHLARFNAPKCYNKNTQVGPLEEFKQGARDGHRRSRRVRPKSLMGLPWRFANACIDAGWILRQEIVWSKPNGLPESVQDRPRRSHEQIFFFTKSERYFSSMDEIREPQVTADRNGSWNGAKKLGDRTDGVSRERGWQAETIDYNPLGKLPGSVWAIPSEPLIIPDWAKEKFDLPDHFAAYPTELVRRIVLGWSPGAICTACGEGRKPVLEKKPMVIQPSARRLGAQENGEVSRTSPSGTMIEPAETTITGYACACTPYTDHPERRGKSWHNHENDEIDGQSKTASQSSQPPRQPVREYHLKDWQAPPTRPAVVLDPFAGTGTTILVARSLGRKGIGIDLSHDYCKLARWRVEESGHGKKAEQRTWRDRQGRML